MMKTKQTTTTKTTAAYMSKQIHIFRFLYCRSLKVWIYDMRLKPGISLATPLRPASTTFLNQMAKAL